MTYPSTYEGFGNAYWRRSTSVCRWWSIVIRFTFKTLNLKASNYWKWTALLPRNWWSTYDALSKIAPIRKSLWITITALPVSITVMLPYAICCATILRPSPVNPLLKAKYLWPTPCQSFSVCDHNFRGEPSKKHALMIFKPVNSAGNQTHTFKSNMSNLNQHVSWSRQSLRNNSVPSGSD